MEYSKTLLTVTLSYSLHWNMNHKTLEANAAQSGRNTDSGVGANLKFPASSRPTHSSALEHAEAAGLADPGGGHAAAQVKCSVPDLHKKSTLSSQLRKLLHTLPSPSRGGNRLLSRGGRESDSGGPLKWPFGLKSSIPGWEGQLFTERC